MCHRFINFETLDYDLPEEQVQAMINDYMRVLTQNEGTASVLYSKAHSELGSSNGQSSIDRERAWTICIVFNPKRDKRVEKAIRAQQQAGVQIAVPMNCKMALEAEQ